MVNIDVGQRAGLEPARLAKLTRAIADKVRAGRACVAFGESYVHDVRNVSETPAVSVHAYSPPLTLMRFYDLRDGRLAVADVLETDDPEATVLGVLAR